MVSRRGYQEGGLDVGVHKSGDIQIGAKNVKK